MTFNRRLFPLAVLTPAVILVLTAWPSAASAAKITWESVKSASGTITSTTTVHGSGTTGIPRNGQLPTQRVHVTVRPVYIEFSVSSELAFRIKYSAEPSGERGGRLRTVLEKYEKRGRRTDWKRKGTIPVRVGKEGEVAFTLGEGTYRLELTGEKVKYEFNIEEAVRESDE